MAIEVEHDRRATLWMGSGLQSEGEGIESY